MANYNTNNEQNEWQIDQQPCTSLIHDRLKDQTKQTNAKCESLHPDGCLTISFYFILILSLVI